jgi:hypothetical protein
MNRPPAPTCILDLSTVADPLGVALEVDGRTYVVVGVTPRRLSWVGTCVICGEKFTMSSARDRILGLSPRCDRHRLGRPPAVG